VKDPEDKDQSERLDIIADIIGDDRMTPTDEAADEGTDQTSK